MQFDIFGDTESVDVVPPATLKNERTLIAARHAADIDALPEKLRPRCAPAAPIPTTKPEVDEWTRTSQRAYLLWLIGAIARGVYREASEANAPYVLMKLNGLAGEW